MEEKFIAPCGMNCGVCISFLAMENDINSQGFNKQYCPGCLPRGKNCAFLKKHCNLLGKGLIRFCFECSDFPCDRLINLDKRYSAKYHLSMIENLQIIKEQGIEKLLEREEAKWRCPKCDHTICCHNGLCLSCDLEKLHQNKKYRWNGE